MVFDESVIFQQRKEKVERASACIRAQVDQDKVGQALAEANNCDVTEDSFPSRYRLLLRFAKTTQNTSYYKKKHSHDVLHATQE